jgi:hypothetical protein
MFNLFGSRESPDDLLKQATAKKKAGDIDAAIELLRKAYAQMAKGDGGATVATFLRLPMYLQAANRPEEAWREFQRLLTDGYPGQIKEAKSIDTWQVYDKMRLFLERQGKKREARKYGIFKRFYECLSEYEQEGRSVLRTFQSKAMAKDLVDEWYSQEDKRINAELLDLFFKHLLSLPRIDPGTLGKEIDDILSRG